MYHEMGKGRDVSPTLKGVRDGFNVKLSISVMAHPDRLEPAKNLARSLPGAEIILDQADGDSPKSALRTAIRAWRSVDPGATHHLLIQDDAVLSECLLERVHRSAALFPESVLGYYAAWDSATGAALRLASVLGTTWVEGIYTEYFPCLAVVIPVQYLPDLLDYAIRYEHLIPHDDAVLGDFLRLAGVQSLISVPSFVDHANMPSVLGHLGNGAYKSACFSSDTRWEPGIGETVAHSFEMLPDLQSGRPMFVVRGENGLSREWFRVSLFRGASRYRVDLGEYESSFNRLIERDGTVGGLTKAIDRQFCYALWVTAANLGVACARRSADVTAVVSGAELPGEFRVAALRSIARGGRMHTFISQDLLKSVESSLDTLVDHGFRQGMVSA